MKQCVLAFLGILLGLNIFAQKNKDIVTLLSSGNNVFVEVVDLTQSIDNEVEIFTKYLNGPEWGFWNIVDSKDDSNFICRLTLEKKGANMNSLGARIVAIVEIYNVSGEKVWVCKKQTGNSSQFTGFNAMPDAMRKVIRRSLTVELYENNGIELIGK